MSKKQRLLFVLAWFAVIGLIVGFEVWMRHTFDAMTPAQHLEAAQHAGDSDLNSIELGMSHLRAIPRESPQWTVANPLENRLIEKKASILAAANAAAAAAAARLSAIKDMEKELRNRGYELTVSRSDEQPDQIVITWSESNDTDHRIRFLSFLRGENSPSRTACLTGYTTVRLRNSATRLFGFSEEYPLECP